jgi:energy-coupling factor transporter transmembrane protein EcfT
VNGTATASTKPRRETELTFLRLVPRDSIVRRLWAGTKVLLVAELALMVSISPSWPVLGVAAGVVALGLLAAHIPLGAFPRLPSWFFAALAIGGVLSMLASTKPIVHVGGMSLSIGGLDEWARFLVLGIVLVASGALVGWTTPLGEVAPALSQLATPLRKLRLPVDEWVVAIALAIRCLPLLIDEIRTLAAARKLRAHEAASPSRATVRQLLIEAHDLLSTAIVVSIRRGRDLADAMNARGGMNGVVSAIARRPRLVDYTVLTAVTALGVVCLFVLHL